MAPLARPAAERARAALDSLSRRGGPAALPPVLTSREAVALMGRSWFMDLLRRGRLPGIQVVPFGVWRCQRETFLSWIEEVANDNTAEALALDRGAGPPHGA